MIDLKLSEIKSKVTNITLLFIKKNTNFNDGFEPSRAMIHEDILSNLKNIYFDPLEKMFTNPYFEQFSCDVTTDGAIQYMSTKGLENNNLFKVLSESINNIDSVNPIGNFEKTLSESYVYAFVFTLSDQKTFTVVRKVYSSNSLKNKGLFTYKNSRLNKVKTDLFALDSKTDCILYEDVIYITGKFNFESIFSYNLHYMEKANDLLNDINKQNIIQNFKEFKTDCLERSTIVKKLSELCLSGSFKSFLNKIKSEPTLIEETIKKFKLGTAIKNNQLVYGDITSLSEIINLISENYFESDITHNQYIARGKNKHTPRGKGKTKSNKKRNRK